MVPILNLGNDIANFCQEIRIEQGTDGITYLTLSTETVHNMAVCMCWQIGEQLMKNICWCKIWSHFIFIDVSYRIVHDKTVYTLPSAILKQYLSPGS